MSPASMPPIARAHIPPSRHRALAPSSFCLRCCSAIHCAASRRKRALAASKRGRRFVAHPGRRVLSPMIRTKKYAGRWRSKLCCSCPVPIMISTRAAASRTHPLPTTRSFSPASLTPPAPRKQSPFNPILSLTRAAAAAVCSAAAPHTSHLTPHTSHLTPHTSHLTPHTSHRTPHTSHPCASISAA